jgi:hypothetical protein
VTADVATNMDIDMIVDMTDDVDAESPCFHEPVSSDPNIFSLLIILIQPIYKIQSIFSFQPIFKIESNFKIQPIFKIEHILRIQPIFRI